MPEGLLLYIWVISYPYTPLIEYGNFEYADMLSWYCNSMSAYVIYRMLYTPE